MNILISNDDGYFSIGIQALREAISNAGHRVFLVAPDRDYSACGMSITVRSPITVREIGVDQYAVSGTPVDCVALALGGLIKSPIDMVVSGVNNGANLCDDVLYSGTVAAAMEGRRLTLPSLAMSIPATKPQHYSTAAAIAVDLIENITSFPAESDISVLNVNVPDVPLSNLKGIRSTILGRRAAPVPHEEKMTEKGVKQCWIGAVGEFERIDNNGVLFDFQSVEQGYVSLTPLKAELFNRGYQHVCERWLASESNFS